MLLPDAAVLLKSALAAMFSNKPAEVCVLMRALQVCMEADSSVASAGHAVPADCGGCAVPPEHNFHHIHWTPYCGFDIHAVGITIHPS